MPPRLSDIELKTWQFIKVIAVINAADHIRYGSEWKVGSSWKLIFPDGRVADSGEILEIDPPRRLVIKWRNEWMPEVTEDGYTRCTFAIEQDGELMKLAVTHEADGPHRLIPNVSKGWPLVLASLKSLLETGKGFERPPTKG